MTHSFHLHRGRWHSPQATALAIGNFDGVHRGHQRIIQQLQKQEALPVVLSFAPHPKNRLTGEALPLLTPYRDRAFWLHHYGLRHWWLLSFNRHLQALSPEDFVRHYFLPAQVRSVWVGEDFRFGHQARGDVETLRRLGRIYDFCVQAVGEVQAEQERISSTRIRKSLLNHDFQTMEALLGHPLSLTGKVRHGAQRGRKMDTPTANIHLNEDFAAPNGVYVVRWQRLWGVANLGYAPTFAQKQRKLEVHFFASALDLYGKTLHLELKHFIRPERLFPDAAALQKQIQVDIEQAKDYIQCQTEEF